MICRPATADDMGFIVETFVRSVRAASTHVEGLDGHQVGTLLTNLIHKGWTATAVEDEGYLIGWVVWTERNRIGWLYVRDTMRGKGVAGFLLKHTDIDMTKPLFTPFLANRGVTRRYWVHHRPFECLP